MGNQWVHNPAPREHLCDKVVGSFPRSLIVSKGAALTALQDYRVTLSGTWYTFDPCAGIGHIASSEESAAERVIFFLQMITTLEVVKMRHGAQSLQIQETVSFV